MPLSLALYIRRKITPRSHPVDVEVTVFAFFVRCTPSDLRADMRHEKIDFISALAGLGCGFANLHRGDNAAL